MSTIQRKYLRELSLEITNAFVVGIIIGKTEARIFQSKNSPDYRGVITFTIRDSKRHFTNCKFWGSRLKVEEYEKIFHIYDVVNVISPKVIPVSNNSTEQQFQPLTSTPFSLVVNEGSGVIEQHFGDSSILNEFKSLINVPVKPLTTILNLADVNVNGIHSVGEHVDLLIVVKSLKPVRSVRTKSGEDSRQCLEVIVMDKSYTNGVSLSIWHKDWIERAIKYWQPLSTILHLMDARVNYSPFYKSAVLGLSSRTIIAENPEAKESAALVSFINLLPPSEMGGTFGPYELPNLDSITSVMTVQQIYDRAEGDLADDSEQFAAVLYAMVTKFDLDGCGHLVGRKCTFCKRKILSNKDICEMEQCQLSYSFNETGEKFDYFFDINVHLTDHTGTLMEGRLNDQFAEKTLNYSVEDFRRLSTTEKGALKWKFLMERFAVKLVVKKKSVTRANMTVILMEMNEVNIVDVAEKVLVY